MVEEYRIRKGLLPFAIYQVEREDPDTADLIIQRAIDRWYEQLLATAPASELPLSDLADKVKPVDKGDGVVEVTLPDNFVRLVSVKCSDWLVPATSITPADSPIGRMQCSKYVRGGCNSPVAMSFSPRKLTLFTSRTCKLDHLIVVTRPADGTYIFDSAALATLPLIEI